MDSTTGAIGISLIVTPVPSPSGDEESKFPLPELPDGLSSPSTILAPKYSAKTKPQLAAKNALWPCSYVPKRPTEAEAYAWTSEEMQWVQEGLSAVLDQSRMASEHGEVSVGLLPLSWLT